MSVLDQMRCLFGAHDYTKWSNPGAYPIPQTYDYRTCKRCGHKDARPAKLSPRKTRRPANEADTTQGKV